MTFFTLFYCFGVKIYFEIYCSAQILTNFLHAAHYFRIYRSNTTVLRGFIHFSEFYPLSRLLFFMSFPPPPFSRQSLIKDPLHRILIFMHPPPYCYNVSFLWRISSAKLFSNHFIFELTWLLSAFWVAKSGYFLKNVYFDILCGILVNL